MSRTPPTLSRTGAPLSLQCSTIQSYFGSNQCVTCPSGIDGTRNFCFTNPNGLTFALPYEVVSARINPTGQARADVGTPSFSLSPPSVPCVSAPGNNCVNDPLCLSDDQCNTAPCCQCCNFPIGVVAQAYATADDITSTCKGSLTGTNNNILCFPCGTNYVPIVRALCTDDCNSNTYYSCIPKAISLTIACSVEAPTNGDGTITPIPFVFWNIYNANGAWSGQGGTIHTVGYRNFPNENGNGTISPGQSIKLYGVGWTWYQTYAQAYILQSYQTCTMVYTFENFAEATATITLVGAPSNSDNSMPGVACAGSLNFQCNQLATSGAWDTQTCEHVPSCCPSCPQG